MILKYNNKKSINKILKTKKLDINFQYGLGENKLIKWDNLKILKNLIEDFQLKNKIDLIYIDPPFWTQNIFTINENRSNTISNSKNDFIAYEDKLIGADFLEFIRERLILMKELLSDNGSIYLHIDYKIWHYIKIIMDEIFWIENFRNDITRIKCNPKNFKRKAYGNIKDLILFYTKTKTYIWNEINEPYSQEDIKKLFKKIDKNGRIYTTIPLHAPGETDKWVTWQEWKGIKPPIWRHRRSDPTILEQRDQENLIERSKNWIPRKKIYADERNGKKKQDIRDYKDRQHPMYPTEKNIDMIKNIILTSSNNNSIVLDCFCWSWTTLQAASELWRLRIGIDQSNEAIKVTKKRLDNNINYKYFD